MTQHQDQAEVPELAATIAQLRAAVSQAVAMPAGTEQVELAEQVAARAAELDARIAAMARAEDG